MRVRRAGHVAHDAGEIERQHALVLRGLQRAAPEAGLFGVGFHQLDLFRAAVGQLEIVDGLLVDVEQRGRRTVLGAHVGDGGAVADREAVRALAEELHVRTHHFFLAQELGQREGDVRRGDARLALAGEPDSHDIGQAHPRGAAQHHVLGLQATHADGDHAERIDVRRMAVGAHAGIGKSDFPMSIILDVHDRRHLLQVDLVHDPVAGGDHVHVGEGLLGPLDEVESILVAAILDGAVLGERVGVEAAALHGQRMVHDKLHRHHGVHGGGIAPLLGDRVAQPGQIDQRRLAQDVVADHAHGEPGEVDLAPALDELAQVLVQLRGVGAAHQVLRMHACRVGQAVPGTGLEGVDGGARVVIVELCARKGLAVGRSHGG